MNQEGKGYQSPPEKRFCSQGAGLKPKAHQHSANQEDFAECYFQVNRPRGRGTEKAHACQLKVKVSLEAAFRDYLVYLVYLVPSLRLGMHSERAAASRVAAEPL
ncbi:hypothetical protein [Nostoc sp.]|uniref:hypothetical protein n=1 Tax=Nostoc sp. TaxID=1180 RepID=UPI002FFBD84A